MLQLNRLRSIGKVLAQFVRANRRYLSDKREPEILVDLLIKSSTNRPNRSIPFIGLHESTKFSKDQIQSIKLPELICPQIQFPKFTYNNQYEAADLADLGKLYLTYYVVRYLNQTRPFLSFKKGMEFSSSFIKHASAIYKKSDSNIEQVEVQFLEYIGQFLLVDLQKCNRFLSAFIREKNDLKEKPISFSDYFNYITPDIESSGNDYDLIRCNNFSSSLELPKLYHPNKSFNPFVLVTNIDKLRNLYHDHGNFETSRSNMKLNDLRSFGKLSFEFYSAMSLLKHYKKSNAFFLGVLNAFQLIMKDILKLSSIHHIIAQYGSNKFSAPSSNKIFFQYLGLLDLESADNVHNSLSSWFDIVIDKLIKQIDNPTLIFSTEPTAVPLSFKRQKLLPRVFKIELTEQLREKLFMNDSLNFDLLNEISALGNEFSVLTISKHLTSTRLNDSSNFEKYTQQYIEQVKNYIDQSVKIKDIIPNGLSQTNFSSSTYIGLFSLVDKEGCQSFLLNLLDEDTSLSYINAFDYMKNLILESDMPLLKLNENNLINNELRLPNIKDHSMITRFMLTNNSIISSKEDSFWLNNNKIKNCLHQWNRIGNLEFKFNLKRFLIHDLSYYSIEYFKPLNELLTSNGFYNFLLNNSGSFTLLSNEKYQNVLLEKRFNKNLVNCQFGQTMAVLMLNNQLEGWTKNLSDIFSKLIDNSNYSEVDEMLSRFNKVFLDSDFVLSGVFRQRRLNYISKHSELLSLPALKNTYEPTDHVKTIGRQLLLYTINKFHLNLGLDSFIKSKAESLKLVEEVVSNQNLDKNDFAIYEKLVYYLLENDSHSSECVCLDLLQKLLNKRQQQIDQRSIKNINVKIAGRANYASSYIWNGGEFILPPHPKTELHKLLLINYFISRTFLNEIKSNNRINIHELPDLCTKFNSMGNEYYKFSILLSIHKNNSTLDEEIIQKIVSILLDRKFKSIIAFNSNLYYPFKSKAYSRLVKSFIKNEYYCLRFGNQSFNQYLGSVSFHDRSAIDIWIERLIITLLRHLKGKTLEDQWAFLIKVTNSIEKHFNSLFRY